MFRFLFLLLPAFALACASASELKPMDIGAAPWSGIAQVNNSAYGRCTGILVAPDLVLTAAHCLFNRRSGQFMRPQSIHILFGYERGEYGFHTVARRITLGDGYDPRAKSLSRKDYAVIDLLQAAPRDFKPFTLADKPSVHSDLVTAGFAQGRPEMLSASPPCRKKGRLNETLIVTDCLLEHGMSGAPLLDADTWDLIGMQIASGRQSGQPIGLAIDALTIRPIDGRIPVSDR